MSRLAIETAARKLAFAPGEACAGRVSWELDEPPESVELRLFWFSEAKGEQDAEIVATESFPLSARGEGSFRFEIPPGPLSFTGSLVTLAWALELVVEPGEETERLPILVSAIGREIRLEALAPLTEEEIKKLPGWLQRLAAKKAAEKRGETED